MASPRPLRNPPITEALVDVRVVGLASAEVFEPLIEEMRARYPIVEPRHLGEATLKFESGGKLSANARSIRHQGYFFRSEAGDRLVQFRLDGFTFNVVGKYTTAEDMLSEALPVWEVYRNAARPHEIVRIAMRYINTLVLPLKEGDDFRRFLAAAPAVPDDLPQGLSEFQTRFVLHFEDRGIGGIVTQTMKPIVKPPSGSPGAPSFILDVDVFRERTLDAGSDLRGDLADLRQVKNTVFFSLLTEDAVRLYE